MILLEDVKRRIEQEKEKYKTPYSKDIGYSMCREYIDNNHLSKAEQLLNIDIWGCIKCLIYLQLNKKMSPEECQNITEKIKQIFNSLEHDKFRQALYTIYAIIDMKDFPQIKEYLQESSKIIAVAKLTKLEEPKYSISSMTSGALEDENYKQYLKELREVEQKTHALIDVIHFIKANVEPTSIIFGFLKARKKMEEDQKEIKETIQSERTIKTREIRRAVSQYFNRAYSSSNIAKQHNMINSFVAEEDRKEKDQDKDNQRMIRMYDKALELLETARKEEEITNARKIIQSIYNEEIATQILMWIDEHNKEYYARLERRLEELNANSTNHYLAVLSKHNISVHMKDIMTFMHNTPEEIDEILSTLPKGDYKVEEIIELLQKTTKAIAEKIKKYMNLGYISSEKIKEHISIYYQGDPKLERMESSIEMINAQGINPKIFSKQPEYFWTKGELLRKNIGLLTTYSLIKSLKNGENFSFLLEENLEEKIDAIIELGYYSFLEEEIGILNYSRIRLKRLELLRQMNIPVDDKETMGEVLESPKFIVSDKDLENYIMDYASYQIPAELSPVIEDLTPYENDKVSISLEGMIISLPKIQRKLTEGSSLWEAIFYGKNVSEEEYKQIMRALNNQSDYKN